VVDAALSLFARQGYRSTGIREIAQALDIGTTSVYSHIRSKADLLGEILIGSLDGVLAAQADAIASSTDVVVQLRRAAEAQVRYFTRHPREALVMTRDFSCAEGSDLDAVMQRRHVYLSKIEQLLQEGVDRRQFSVDSVKVTAFAIIEMCEAVPKWFRSNGDLSEDRISYLYGEFAVRIARGQAAALGGDAVVSTAELAKLRSDNSDALARPELRSRQ
jgi:AcrR family transcriptional regulator